MVGRWFLYLSVVAGCSIFYLSYQEWFSWLALVGVYCLPALSLLVSLPAMLTTRIRPQAPGELSLGEHQTLTLACRCPLPMPALKCRVRIARPLTGQQWKLKEGALLPTEHCGALEIRPYRVGVSDYLGLFRLPVRYRHSAVVTVWPEAVPVSDLPDLSRYLDQRWKPRPGGGSAENHELRLYRPGDDLRQIHWKLSAKTGKLILREPMEPERGLALVNLILSGTPEELDRKLGRLLWVSDHLLSRGVRHEIRCLTGQGQERFRIALESDIRQAMTRLLRATPAAEDEYLPEMPAIWYYLIGGEPDED